LEKQERSMTKMRSFDPTLEWVSTLGLNKLTPYYSTQRGAALLGDSMLMLKALPSASVDLVVTSPPFALTRKKEYGNEPVERYLEWFTPFCLEIKRVLKPTGSFVLDIGGVWIPGAPVRSIYHFDLAVRLSKEFHLAQEFYWYNPAKLPTPAEWVTIRRIRVKDAVNMIWWFSKQEFPKADNRKVLRPYSDSMRDLIRNGYKAKKRPSGHDISDTFQRDNGGAIPPNLLEIANTESNSYYLRRCKSLGIKPHPARYPEALVQFFVDFLTDQGDLVVDPFGGSNVTGAVCERGGRRWLVSELRADYLDGSLARFEEQPTKRFKTPKKRTSNVTTESLRPRE
jgi:DNA modification methylase